MNVEESIKTSNQLPESRRLVLGIFITANVISERIAETLKPFDISAAQFNVLRILRGQKGKPANLCTIQERMVSKMSNTTRLVDKLIQKGLVERVICKANRRKVEISITPQGLEFLNEVDPVIDELENKIISSLGPEERRNLEIILNKIRS